MDESFPPNVHRKGSAIVMRCSCEIWKWSSQSQVQGVAICSGDFRNPVFETLNCGTDLHEHIEETQDFE
ncbi:hypothetical protein L596_005541 [Steinernema carpocapsae]|uniref:Uncharacterized protein n=1 Tax=Steinernema carpocapsae TaxID=34508 RepID=A0A4U8V0X1_STECR|nr:hypothetical protein L596_005541 [Steinernema carpocapsae]